MTTPNMELMSFPAGAFQTNCYIAVDKSDTAEKNADGLWPATVIDPGHGAAEVIKKAAAEKSFYVAQIVLTHGHIDHVRDVAEFDVPVHIHPADKEMVEDPQVNLSMPDLAQVFDVENMQPPQELHDLGDTIDIAGTTFTVHHMPGHSPGSVMFRIPGFVIGGDVLFQGSIGRTDLPGANPEDMMLSLKRLVSEFEDNDVVLPGHGPQTTVGAEKKTNPFLQDVK